MTTVAEGIGFALSKQVTGSRHLRESEDHRHKVRDPTAPIMTRSGMETTLYQISCDESEVMRMRRKIQDT